jgi:CheY-like chemotaxis protein
MSGCEEPLYNILIAEDDKNQRLALYDMLEASDLWNVYSANNGQQTIELLQQTQEHLDLVLLDYNMPEMDGLDVLVWMRNKPKFKDIPVIMMSTEEEVKNLSYCIEKGAADYMVKPIRVHNIRVLDKYIKQGAEKHNPAESVADYEKVRTLGRGASGVVDLVTSKKDLELYAMKMIPMFHFDEFKKKAAQNEITLLKVLDSPYVVKYYDHFVKNGNMYIIMEYCEGGTIDDKIQEYKIKGRK